MRLYKGMLRETQLPAMPVAYASYLMPMFIFAFRSTLPRNQLLINFIKTHIAL